MSVRTDEDSKKPHLIKDIGGKMKLSDFATNKELEVNGVWHDLGDKTRVLVARAGNKKYTEALRSRMEKYQNRLARRDKTMEPIAEKILTECMAKYILLGWENLEDENKKIIPYSVEKAIEILSDEKYKDFRDLIELLSNDMASYQEKKKEEIVGN